MEGISTFLWFDSQAVEAARHYVSIFPNARIVNDPGDDDAMTVTFEIEGREFIALNGGPVFAFTPAISFFVRCQDQQEVDYFWGRLCEGGAEGQCGWLVDRFGVSWQVVPTVLGSLLGGADPEGAARAMDAMLKMGRLDIAELQRAYDGS